MKADFLENLKDVVQVQVETDKDSLKSLLLENKVVITVTRGPKVLTRLVRVSAEGKKRVASKPSIPQEVAENIKVVRKVLKGNADGMSIFVLIEKLKSSIGRLDLREMTPQASTMFNNEIKDLIAKLSSTQKLLLGYTK